MVPHLVKLLSSVQSEDGISCDYGSDWIVLEQGSDPYHYRILGQLRPVLPSSQLSVTRPMQILGISGWSGCGKTTLIEKLIPRLTAQGCRVSTLKHAHHDVDLDTPGKDTWRHRQAGAYQTLLATGRRWALLHELRDAPEPSLRELTAHLQPVDLVLVEGWKRGDYPKLEVWRRIESEPPPRFPHDHSIIALASDPVYNPAVWGRPDLPAFALDDINAMAAWVLDDFLKRPAQSVISPAERR